ncbi:MAG TPA: endonuclease III [Nitrospiria bacterium]|nr:endonuclease III [Nitrospiria bacterium]
MTNQQLPRAIALLKSAIRQWPEPIVGVVAKSSRDPFRVLIATVLSLRTKDRTTAEASARLFAVATTPEEMVKLSERRIASTIYPVGFYRTKAKAIRALCRQLLEHHGGQVPKTLDELLALPGVGRKTANLVLTVGFGLPGICVDTHVHRISNRWGYVKTTSPDKTEMALRGKLPRRYWITFNDLLVPYGQHLCAPVSPWCSRCRLQSMCDRVGVRTHR